MTRHPLARMGDHLTSNTHSRVQHVPGRGGLDAISVDLPTAHALIYLQGAHLAQWIPTGQEPVLWMSARSVFEDGQPLRGGIPVCFPWFGSGPNGDLAPNHGWARIRPWEFTGIDVSDEGEAALSFVLESGPSDPVAPSTRLEITHLVGRTLATTLRATNNGSAPVIVESALHAYWSVHRLPDIRVEGLDHSAFIARELVDSPTRPAESFPALSGQTLDRMYPFPARLTIHDPAAHRAVVLEGEQVAQTVVWTPGAEGARAAADIGDDEWREFVCAEAVNARQHAVRIEPGQSHEFTLHASIKAE